MVSYRGNLPQVIMPPNHFQPIPVENLEFDFTTDIAIGSMMKLGHLQPYRTHTIIPREAE